MSESPEAQRAGEAIGTLIGLALTAGIDSEMQQATEQLRARERARLPLLRRIGYALRLPWLDKPHAP